MNKMMHSIWQEMLKIQKGEPLLKRYAEVKAGRYPELTKEEEPFLTSAMALGTWMWQHSNLML